MMTKGISIRGFSFHKKRIANIFLIRFILNKQQKKKKERYEPGLCMYVLNIVFLFFVENERKYLKYAFVRNYNTLIEMP